MSLYINTIRKFNRNLKLFYVATAMQGFIFFGIYGLLLNLYLIRLGYGPQFIGTVNGVAPLVLAIGSVPAGLFSRRLGSRKGLIVGYFGIFVGFSLLPLSSFGPPEMQEIWIVASYALAWLCAALLIVNFGPFIMEKTIEVERDHAFAIQSALFPVAGFVGSLLGGLLPMLFANLTQSTLETALPYRHSLSFGAALYLIPTLFMWLTAESELLEEAAARQNEVKSKAPIELIVVVALVSLLVVIGDWAIQLYLNVYLDTVLNLSTALIGGLLGAGRLLGLMAFFSPFFMNRFGHRRTLLWSMILASVTFLPLILIGHWIAAGVTFMALLAVTAIINPTYGRFSQAIVAPEWRTTMASAISMTTGIAIAITAFGGSQIIVRYGYQTLFIVSAAMVLAGAILFGIYFRNQGDVLEPAG